MVTWGSHGKKKHVVVHTTYHSTDISYKWSHVGINIHQQPTHIHSEHILGEKTVQWINWIWIFMSQILGCC